MRVDLTESNQGEVMKTIKQTTVAMALTLAAISTGTACTPSSSISLLDPPREDSHEKITVAANVPSPPAGGGAADDTVDTDEVGGGSGGGDTGGGGSGGGGSGGGGSGGGGSGGGGTLEADGSYDDLVRVVPDTLDGSPSIEEDMTIQVKDKLVDQLREKLNCDPRLCDPLEYLEIVIRKEVLTEKFGELVDQDMNIKVSVDELADSINSDHSIIIRTPGPTFPKPESSQIQVYDLGSKVVGSISYAPVGTGEFAVLGLLESGKYGAFVANADKGVISSVITNSVPIAQVTRINTDLAKAGSVLSGQSGNLLVGLASASSSSISSYQTLSTSSSSTRVSVVRSYSLRSISTLSTFSTFAVESYYISPSIGTSLLRVGF